MSDGRPVGGSVFFYAPNKGAPVFFTIAFATSGAYHLWQCIHYKCFKVTALLPICCLLFTAGFAVREYGAFHYENLNVYIASTFLIYMSPPLLELANYHILGRILYYIPYLAPIHPGRVLTTFGTLSSLVEVLSAIGVSYVANTSLPARLITLGDALLKASLVLQLVVMLFFFLLAGTFHARCVRAGITSRRVHAPLLTLYLSTLIILGRTIYRTVEYFGSNVVRSHAEGGGRLDPMMLSPVIRYEWFFYVFEAVFMLANSVLWNVRHPRRYLPEDYRVYLAQDGATELTGPGWKDKRSYAMTALDPFGWFGDGSGSGKGDDARPFWEENGFDGASKRRQDAVGGAV
ncbi:hypothetical protein B0T17DRAFT_505055 [Bombardia bombarda]|uniref:Uncharacterized protein n=1 Tax=Bombardia bombarda TaxID=252184 RepID=A0AA39X6T6_9PEZI|nr:hypothetical protein B0T17DRAFT_505055 [Bombardia bombarda]